MAGAPMAREEAEGLEVEVASEAKAAEGGGPASPPLVWLMAGGSVWVDGGWSWSSFGRRSYTDSFEYRDLGELRSRSELRRDTKSEGIAALHRGEGTRTLFRRSENGSFRPINTAFHRRNALIDREYNPNRLRKTKQNFEIH